MGNWRFTCEAESRGNLESKFFAKIKNNKNAFTILTTTVIL